MEVLPTADAPSPAVAVVAAAAAAAAVPIAGAAAPSTNGRQTESRRRKPIRKRVWSPPPRQLGAWENGDGCTAPDNGSGRGPWRRVVFRCGGVASPPRWAKLPQLPSTGLAMPVAAAGRASPSAPYGEMDVETVGAESAAPSYSAADDERDSAVLPHLLLALGCSPEEIQSGAAFTLEERVALWMAVVANEEAPLSLRGLATAAVLPAMRSRSAAIGGFAVFTGHPAHPRHLTPLTQQAVAERADSLLCNSLAAAPSPKLVLARSPSGAFAIKTTSFSLHRVEDARLPDELERHPLHVHRNLLYAADGGARSKLMAMAVFGASLRHGSLIHLDADDAVMHYCGASKLLLVLLPPSRSEADILSAAESFLAGPARQLRGADRPAALREAYRLVLEEPSRVRWCWVEDGSTVFIRAGIPHATACLSNGLNYFVAPKLVTPESIAVTSALCAERYRALVLGLQNDLFGDGVVQHLPAMQREAAAMLIQK